MLGWVYTSHSYQAGGSTLARLVSPRRRRCPFHESGAPALAPADDAADRAGLSVSIDEQYVDAHLGELIKDEDLTRYIL